MYKKPGPATPSPLSVGTPGDKRSGPVEDRFRRILERRRVESEEESMDETLSEAGEDVEVGNTPEPKPSEEEITTQELLKDLSGENWADHFSECRSKGEEHLRGKQGCVPRHSGRGHLARVLERLQSRSE